MSPWAVVLAGGIGGLARYWVSGAVQRRAGPGFPVGTLVVNVLGCVALGVAEVSGAGPVLAVGFLGGFTTFSTWMVETVETLSLGRVGRRRAAVELGAAILLGTLGYVVGRRFGG